MFALIEERRKPMLAPVRHLTEESSPLAAASALARRLPTFAAVGAVCTATYIVLALLLGIAGVPPVAASLLAYCCGMVLSYNGHRLLTFASRRPHREGLPLFLCVNLFGIAVSLAVPGVLTLALDLPAPVAVLATAMIVPLSNFLGHNFISFRERSAR
jgi:putative flippase GtrA